MKDSPPCECHEPGPCPRYNRCMLGNLHYWCKNDPEKIQHLTVRQTLPKNCGKDEATPILEAQIKYQRTLNTISLPPPEEKVGTVPKSWIVGITTAPRKEPTLERCLDSIRKAGWEDIHVFAEPMITSLASPSATSEASATEVTTPVDPQRGSDRSDHPSERTREPVTAASEARSAVGEQGATEVIRHANQEKLGPWRNFAQMIEYFSTQTEADAYLLCQDDALFFDGPVREYLERHVLWITDKPHVLSLYTSSMYLETRAGIPRAAGWHILGRGGRFGWWGAVAFVLSRESLLDFYHSDVFKGWLTRRKSWLERDPSTIAQVDTAIGFWAPPKGGLWTCLPSLVQHVGDTSTIYKSNRATGRRMAQWMLGSPPPHRPPGYWEKAVSVGVSVAKWAKDGFQVATKRLRRDRMAICRQCEHLNPKNVTCNLCGCFVEIKAMLPQEECPDNPARWRKIADAPKIAPVPTWDGTKHEPAPECGGCPKKPPAEEKFLDIRDPE